MTLRLILTMPDSGREKDVAEVLRREADILEDYADGIFDDGSDREATLHNIDRAIEAMRNAASVIEDVTS
jgi:hypothetical protein